MIRTHQLTKFFGRTLAVDGLDLAVPRGEVVGFLGPNGAGKSTSLRMIAGYIAPSSGSATVGGHDIARESRMVRGLIGYLPESTPLYGEMRVQEYLHYRGRLFDLRKQARRTAVDLAIKRCWLSDVRRKPIRYLSKGFRQRVGLASAMLHEPPLLLLDEPTSGLDPTQILEMRGLIQELAGRHTILLSTHILPEVELTCSRVIIIANGRVQAQGTIQEVQASATPDARYIVEADSGKAGKILRQIKGAKQVVEHALDGSWRRLVVTAGAGADDLRDSIARAMREADVPVRELRCEKPSLEQVFIRLTSGSHAVPGEGAS